MEFCKFWLSIFAAIIVTSTTAFAEEQFRVDAVETTLCKQFAVIERVHELTRAKKYAAAIAAIPPPPECIDLYEGQIVEGPFEEKQDSVFGIMYIKVHVGDQAYWMQKSDVVRPGF